MSENIENQMGSGLTTRQHYEARKALISCLAHAIQNVSNEDYVLAVNRIDEANNIAKQLEASRL